MNALVIAMLLTGGNGVGSGGLNGFQPASVDGTNTNPASVTTAFVDAGTIHAQVVIVDIFLDAGNVSTGKLWFPGGSNGIATVSVSGSSGMNLATNGKNLNLSATTGNLSLTGGGTFNSAGAGAGGCLFCSGTGAVQFTGDTHANRSTSAGIFGYCTTDGALYVGNGVVAKDMFSTTCTLNAGSPSTCTATVPAAGTCTCSDVGTSAVIAANGCDVSLSGTTLTVTSANAAGNVVNIHCF